MAEKARFAGLWHGFFPPQYVFGQKRFKCVVLDPPNLDPGSWIGAGKALFDPEKKEFLLTARPRKAEGGARGFGIHIYRSKDGESFELTTVLSKSEVCQKSGLEIHSIEGTQLLRDPWSGKWHLYASVDTGPQFVWGGLVWQTLLLTASQLKGPWQSEGIVLKNGQSYDAQQARDATIDIIDGLWFCLYKAVDEDQRERPALAISSDGYSWKKRGIFAVEGVEKLAFFSGSIFPGTNGPLFVGLETKLEDTRLAQDQVTYADQYKIGHGGGPPSDFVAYNIDYRNMNLEPIFSAPWKAHPKYEHEQHPLLGYASLVYDPLRHRMLTYVEAIDRALTTKIGINETVERLLLYETSLG